MSQTHTIILTVNNKVGILSRVTGLLAQRGYNIESAIAAPTEAPCIYKIILVVKCNEEKIEQVTKQLHKLIDTIRVVNISHKENYIVREYIILRVSICKGNREKVFKLIEVFSARILDINDSHIITELSGKAGKVDRFIKLLKEFGIKEFVRSGEFAMTDHT